MKPRGDLMARGAAAIVVPGPRRMGSPAERSATRRARLGVGRGVWLKRKSSRASPLSGLFNHKSRSELLSLV